MARKREPGFRDGGFFAPGPNDMRPDIRHPADREGAGRSVLEYSQDTQFVQDFAPDQSTISTSPASARHTPGMPTARKPEESKDEGIEIQMGIRRP